MNKQENTFQKNEQEQDTLTKTEETIPTPELSQSLQTETEKTMCDIDEKPTRLDSIKEAIIKLNGGIKDSISYKFSLDNELGTEGNTGTALYKKGLLKLITLHMYSDSGQCDASYEFKTENKIKVCEKHFSYVKSVSQIKSFRGEPMSDEHCSYINKEGENISKKKSKHNTHAIDVFPFIQYHVPFSLRE